MQFPLFLRVFPRFASSSNLGCSKALRLSPNPSVFSVCRMSKFVTRLNVVSGKMEWGLLDDDYDYWQEIARSRYGDMLHDTDRNIKYSLGLKKAIEAVHSRGQRANVLDIGTGTGLLALLAVQHGADSVTACEAFLPVAQAAKLIIEDNGKKDKIKLVMKRSTALQIPGDLSERCNVLVSEVFDTELIGEGALGVFIHAHEHLLTEDVITVPYSATVYIQVVQSEFLLQHNHLADNTGVNVPVEWRDCPGPSSVHDVQLSQLYPRQDFRRLSEIQPLYEFLFSKRGALKFQDEKTTQISPRKPGRCDAVFMWWDLKMDPEGEIILTCAPNWAQQSVSPEMTVFPWRDHWMQSGYLEGPSETFGLHMLFSSGNESIANGHAQQRRQIKVLGENTAEAAKQSWKNIFVIENDHLASQIFRTWLKANDVDKRVVIIEKLTDLVSDTDLDGEKIDVIVSEPYFTNALLPWQHMLILLSYVEHLRPHLSPNLRMVPWEARIRGCLMEFDDLWKIRSPVTSVEGINVRTFDQLVEMAMAKADSSIEPQPLWEYPGKILSEIFTVHIFDLDRPLVKDFLSVSGSAEAVTEGCGVAGQLVELTFRECYEKLLSLGTYNGIAFWVEYSFPMDGTDMVWTTGLDGIPLPGEYVRWNPYHRQGVYLARHGQKIRKGDRLSYECLIDYESGEMSGKFSLSELVNTSKDVKLDGFSTYVNGEPDIPPAV